MAISGQMQRAMMMMICIAMPDGCDLAINVSDLFTGFASGQIGNRLEVKVVFEENESIYL